MTEQTSDLLQRETGDPTYRDRVARYEYVMQRLSEKPKPTYEQIGKELGGLSRQNISRLVKRGTVRPAGRQRSNEGRKQALQKRIERWQSRRTAAEAAGKPTTKETEWIAELTRRMDALG